MMRTLIAGTALGGCALACGGGAAPVALPPSPNSTTCQRAVTYFVEGTAKSVDITIQNASGNTALATNRKVPLQLTASRACA
jgi:hypothetical protein